MPFEHLQAYARFILEHRLDELTRLNVARAREVELPLLQLFEGYSENQLFAYSRASLHTLLEELVAGTALENQQASLARWQADQIPEVPRLKIDTYDLVFSPHTRKYAMLKLLRTYTRDLDLYEAVTLDLDTFYAHYQAAALQVFVDIQREALRDERNFFQTVIDHTLDGITAYDLECRITLWNRAVEQRTGVLRQEALGKKFYELFPDYEASEEEQAALRVLGGESVMLRNREVKGQARFYNADLIPLTNAQGQVIGGLTVSHDITQARQAEQQLKQEKEFSELLIENSPDGIVALDTALRYTAWNPAVERLTGKSRSEVLGRKPYEVFPGSEQTEGVQAMRAALEGQIVKLPDRKYLNRPGYYYSVVFPLRNVQGEITGVMSIIHDISYRKEAEQRLLESQQYLQDIVDATPNVIYVYDLQEGREVYVNQQLAQLLGYTPEAIKRSHVNYFRPLLHPDDQARLPERESQYQHLPSRQVLNVEYRLRHAQDNYHWFAAREVVHRRTSEGQPWLILGVAEDVTEQKRAATLQQEAQREIVSKNEQLSGALAALEVAKQDLVRLNGELEEKVRHRTEALAQALSETEVKNHQLLKSNELLDNFVYLASHDLKAPVSNLKFALQLTRETLEEDKKAQLLGLVAASTERLDQTINSLVEVVQVQSDQIMARKIQFKAVFDLVMADFASELASTGGTVETDFSRAPDITYVEAFLVSTLKNLIGNALKYRSIDRAPRVSIRTETSAEYVVLTIRDNGIGIDVTKFSNRLFKPFNRFSRQATGRGIGLYLVRSMIEKNHGRIEVSSRVNQGTTFTAYLRAYTNEH